MKAQVHSHEADPAYDLRFVYNVTVIRLVTCNQGALGVPEGSTDGQS